MGRKNKRAGRPVVPPRQRDGRRTCRSHGCDIPAEPGRLQCFACATAVGELGRDLDTHRLVGHLSRIAY